MPDGHVQRIDQKRALVYIVRRGRTYSAPLDEVESKARVPSARVRFDLVRVGGSESAANVRLRVGTRTNKRHRRFGDLSGAKRPGAKTTTTAKRAYGIDVTTQPFRVAEAWLQAMSDLDFDGATSLYLSRAAVHTPNQTIVGRRAIRAELERSPLQKPEAGKADVRGFDRYVQIFCQGADGNDHTISMEIERGSIVEQWIDVEPNLVDAPEQTDEIETVIRGEVPSGAETHGRDRVGRLIENSGRRVRFARIKFTAADNPAVRLPAMVEAAIEFDNGLVRSHASAAGFAEATDLVAERLRRQIEQNHDRERHRTAGLPAPDNGWQHGNLARVETPYFDRPEAEREIVRHKSIGGDELTVDEAAWDMSALDYDFFLFVELESGEDALLERTPDGKLLLRRLSGEHIPPTGSAVDVDVTDQPASELQVSEAIGLLDETAAPRLFFKNRDSQRANVIYRRYDGHYGLITPAVDLPDTDAAQR